MIKKNGLMLLVISVGLLTSCQSQINTSYLMDYVPAPAVTLKNMDKLNLLVIGPVVDAREEGEKNLFDPNVDPLILIPLWPYSHSSICPVIRYNYFQLTLTETLHKLFVRDLRASKIFNNVIPEITYNGPHPIKQTYAKAYRLDIRLKKAIWSRYLTSYGLSYPGTILWAIGFPISYGTVTLEIDATLYTPKNKTLGTIRISKDISCIEWIFDQLNYKPPVSEFKLAQVFPELTKDLRAFIIEQIKK